MTVLVTGGTGFVGMALIEALLGRGDAVIAVAIDELPAAARSIPGRERLKLVKADIRDRDAMDMVMGEHRIDRIFHGAVITAGTEREAADPKTILDVNLAGTVAVLESARRHGVSRFVYPSSVAVYGESLYGPGPMSEATTPPVPVGLYGITKYAAERMSLRLGELWGLDVVCPRIGAVFGPWERDTGLRDLLGPQFQLARAAIRGETAILPARFARRDWIYSRDLAAGLLSLLDVPAPRYRVYNLSAACDWTQALPDFCAKLQTLNPAFRWRIAGSDEKPTIVGHEDRDRAMQDTTRLAEDVGFTRRTGPAEAMADYARWIEWNAGMFEC